MVGTDKVVLKLHSTDRKLAKVVPVHRGMSLFPDLCSQSFAWPIAQCVQTGQHVQAGGGEPPLALLTVSLVSNHGY
jgi:hypothetical protein